MVSKQKVEMDGVILFDPLFLLHALEVGNPHLCVLWQADNINQHPHSAGKHLNSIAPLLIGCSNPFSFSFLWSMPILDGSHQAWGK